VSINGRRRKNDAEPGTCLGLSRSWKDGDTIEVRMPFDFHLCHLSDQPNIASIFYGPVLLAAEETEKRDEWREVTLDASDLGRSITGNPEALRFEIGYIPLKPFFKTYGRHSVYLDVNLD